MYHIRLQIYKLIFILPPPSPTFFPTFAPQLHSEHDARYIESCPDSAKAAGRIIIC